MRPVAATRLEVYQLPSDDGGGRYEVAGINERFNKTLCDGLVSLVRAGQQAEAERRADAHDRGEIGAISLEDALTRLRAGLPGQAAG